MAIEDIARVLNHTVGPRVTAGYNAYAHDPEKRLALSTWARNLTAILDEKDGEKRTTKVAPIAAAK